MDEYSKFRKEKDYLLAVMTHLDILVEPKRYDPHSHSCIPTDFYYVASMIRKLENLVSNNGLEGINQMCRHKYNMLIQD
jgi:hypothetical protein